MATAINGATLYGNNDVVVYMPNSLTYDIGKAERTVTPQIVGNGTVENVVTEDFSTAKGKLQFDLKTTSENEALVIGWLDNFDSNVFKVVSTDGKTRVFEKSVIINKPEFDTSSDGVISIEIESSQAAIA
jgi:hypothetical protein